MTASGAGKPLSLRKDAETVITTLNAAGHLALLAGGCVRDQMLGLSPQDFDVATDAPPVTIRQLFKHTQAVGAAFGVMLVRIGDSTIEVARFRTDGAYLDGRHPTAVQFATPEEDARRRDFTINGLFYDIGSRRVIDYVGGEADLHAKTLRAIGAPDQRFAEDHLRLLRAVRFAARFDLAIEPATATAMNASAAKLAGISPERIAEELRAMLAPPSRTIAWQLLNRFDLAEVVFRFAPPRSLPHWPSVPLGETAAPLPAVLAGQSFIRHSAGEWTAALCKTYQRSLRQALRWSNSEADVFETLLTRIIAASQGPLTLALKRRWTDDRNAIGKPAANTAAENLAATQRIAISSIQKRLFNGLANLRSDCGHLAALSDELTTLEKTPNPPPLVSGDDLRSAGLVPGPAFKDALHRMYDEQLEGRLADKSAAIAFAVAAATDPSSG